MRRTPKAAKKAAVVRKAVPRRKPGTRSAPRKPRTGGRKGY